MKHQFPHSNRRLALCLAAGLITLLVAIPLMQAQQRGGGRGPAARPAPAPRPAPARTVVVDRTEHGSVRHVDTHVVERPVEEHHVDVAHGPDVHHDIQVHRDVEVDIHGHRAWDDFRFGRHLRVLPVGFLNFNFGGVPYYYDDGIYYQPADDGYQEVYPPMGAQIPSLPDGAIQVEAGGQVYYYAGGAFYVQQADGTYAIVQPPIGAIVPELPPGANQVSINGTTAYQFNGVNYEPVFANGVTQYEIVPQ
jgi:hypothetical protein